jgi:hypothetical protein
MDARDQITDRRRERTRRVLSGLVRLSWFVMLGSVATAVAVGRYYVPEGRHLRREAVALREVNGYLVGDESPGCRFLDPETGRYARMAIPGGDSLLFAQVTPWRDGRGRSQVVGRWMGRDRGDGGARGFGLARYSYPSGEVIDRIPVEVAPAAPPAWFPDLSARLIYAGTDGRLYRLAFEDEEGRSAGRDEELRPVPLSWQCTPPGVGRVHVEDPSFLTVPALRGRLVVAIRQQADLPDGRVFLPSQIWWLELNPRATAIVAAGRLTVPDVAKDPMPVVEERMPSIAAAADGTPMLAYLSRAGGYHDWQIRLGPVTIDPETRAPKAVVADSLLIAEKSAAVAPAFSPDGRWLNGVILPERSRSEAERFAVVGAREAVELARRAGGQEPGPIPADRVATGKPDDSRKVVRAPRQS